MLEKPSFLMFIFTSLFCMAALLLTTESVRAEEQEQDQNKDVAGWIFYLDNDLFITPNLDRDYTAGMSLVVTGSGSASHLFSIDALLGALDSWSGLKDSENFILHSFEFGISGFTPKETETRFVLQDDRPYASLVYIANNRQYVNLQEKRSLISTLSVGVLGLNIAGNLQNAVHEVVNLDDTLGWHNQISTGGELTFRYSLSTQILRWYDYSTADKYEVKTALRGSIGYISDATWSVSGRWGDIRSPWWTFNPQMSEYTEKSAPALPASKPSYTGEFYYWAGLSVHLRAYNVFLQGQHKKSAVTYVSDELNHVLLEMWFGVTTEIFRGMQLSYMVRGQTTEVRHGKGSRNPFWGGFIVSQAF